MKKEKIKKLRKGGWKVSDYNDFLEDVKIPRSERVFCYSCEQWIPKVNPIHTCYDAKEERRLFKKAYKHKPIPEIKK